MRGPSPLAGQRCRAAKPDLAVVLLRGTRWCTRTHESQGVADHCPSARVALKAFWLAVWAATVKGGARMPRLDSGLVDPRHRNGCEKSFAMPLRGDGWRAMRRLICRDRGDGATGWLCSVIFAGSILPQPQRATQGACWAATPLRRGFTSQADHRRGHARDVFLEAIHFSSPDFEVRQTRAPSIHSILPRRETNLNSFGGVENSS